MLLNKENILLYAMKKKFFTIDEIKIDFQITKKEINKLNIILTRLCENQEIYRYEQGIYGYQKQSTFFNKRIPYPVEEMLDVIYIKDDIGYYAGADYFNRLGLSDWCAAKKVIVTNKVKRNKVMKTYILKKPKTTITNKNMHYLQFLDMIEDLIDKNFDINNMNYKNIIFKELITYDYFYLTKICKTYYKKEVMNFILNLVRDYYDIT